MSNWIWAAHFQRQTLSGKILDSKYKEQKHVWKLNSLRAKAPSSSLSPYSCVISPRPAWFNYLVESDGLSQPQTHYSAQCHEMLGDLKN